MPNEKFNIIKTIRMFESRLHKNKAFKESETTDIIQKLREKIAEDEKSNIEQGYNPKDIMPILNKVMSIQGANMGADPLTGMPTINWIDREKKEKLENLVKKIFLSEYGKLVDILDLTIDFKLLDGFGEINDAKNDMEDSPEDIQPNIEEEEIDEEEILDEVDKRKIANLITQGSAKNTHRLIHLYKDDIDEIDSELFDAMDKLIKSQETFELGEVDNIEKGSGAIIRQFMNGYAKVEFDKDDDDDEMEFEDFDEFDDLFNDSDLDSLLNGDDDELSDLEDKAELLDLPEITLKARALDIVVLLHEAVKSFFEFIASQGLPEDEVVADIVISNVDTLDDEKEDLIFGPYVRKMTMDYFIGLEKFNEFDDVVDGDSLPYIFGLLIECKADQFLKVFRGILFEDERDNVFTLDIIRPGIEEGSDDVEHSVTGNSTKVGNFMLEVIIEEFEEYNKLIQEWEENQDYDQEDHGSSDSQDFASDVLSNVNDDNDNDDGGEESYDDYLSKLSKSELEKEIDDALDSGEYDKIEIIKKYM